MPPEHLLGEIFQISPDRRNPQDRPRTTWRKYCISLACLGNLPCPPRWVGRDGWAKGMLGFSGQTAALATRTVENGWTDRRTDFGEDKEVCLCHQCTCCDLEHRHRFLEHKFKSKTMWMWWQWCVTVCVSLLIFGPCELSDTTKLSFMRQTQGVRKPSFNFAHTGSWRCPFTLLHFYSCTDLRRKFRSWSFPTQLCKPGVVDSICRPTGDMPTMLASPKLDVSFSSGLFIHYLYFI